MRFYICVSFDEKRYKLVWVNEDPKGVYIGMYKPGKGSHYSYHKDGRRHHKTHGSEKPEFPHDAIPIEEITSFRQIIHQAFRLSDESLHGLGLEYQKEDQKSSSVVFLDAVILRDKALALDTYLLHHTRENQFLKVIFDLYKKEKYKILVCNIHKLEHFPRQKLAVVLMSAEGVFEK